jgi:hypothetical protein
VIAERPQWRAAPGGDALDLSIAHDCDPLDRSSDILSSPDLAVDGLAESGIALIATQSKVE